MDTPPLGPPSIPFTTIARDLQLSGSQFTQTCQTTLTQKSWQRGYRPGQRALRDATHGQLMMLTRETMRLAKGVGTLADRLAMKGVLTEEDTRAIQQASFLSSDVFTPSTTSSP